MQPTHTPAPWRKNGCELIGDSTLIATLHWHSGRGAANDADGHLIAAAPELLATVQQCAAQFRFYEQEHTKAGKHEKAATNKRFADLCDTAIARATGMEGGE